MITVCIRRVCDQRGCGVGNLGAVVIWPYHQVAGWTQDEKEMGKHQLIFFGGGSCQNVGGAQHLHWDPEAYSKPGRMVPVV